MVGWWATQVKVFLWTCNNINWTVMSLLYYRTWYRNAFSLTVTEHIWRTGSSPRIHFSATWLTGCSSTGLFLGDTVARNGGLGTEFWLLGAGGGVKTPGAGLILQGTLRHWCWGGGFGLLGTGCEGCSLDGALLRTGYWRKHWPGCRNVSLLRAWENHSAGLHRRICSLLEDIQQSL